MVLGADIEKMETTETMSGNTAHLMGKADLSDEIEAHGEEAESATRRFAQAIANEAQRLQKRIEKLNKLHR